MTSNLGNSTMESTTVSSIASTQSPEEEVYVIGSGYYITSAIVSTIFIASFWPCLDLFNKLWINPAPKKSNAFNKSKHNGKILDSFSKLLNISVTIAMIGFWITALDHLIFNLIVYIPNLNVTESICQIHLFGDSVPFYLAKLAMYVYFVLRAWHTFYFTNMPYSASLIIAIIVILFITHVLMCFFWMYIMYDAMGVEQTDINSIICTFQSDKQATQLSKIDLLCAACLDVLFAIFTVYMLVGKLFKFTHNSVYMRARGNYNKHNKTDQNGQTIHKTVSFVEMIIEKPIETSSTAESTEHSSKIKTTEDVANVILSPSHTIKTGDKGLVTNVQESTVRSVTTMTVSETYGNNNNIVNNSIDKPSISPKKTTDTIDTINSPNGTNEEQIFGVNATESLHLGVSQIKQLKIDMTDEEINEGMNNMSNIASNSVNSVNGMNGMKMVAASVDLAREYSKHNNNNNKQNRRKTKVIKKKVEEIKGLNAENEHDVLFFHQMTDRENKILFLSSKLLILMIIACISSFAVFILFFEAGFENAYTLDYVINMYCIWLCFESTSNIFWDVFQGKYCLKCFFPYIKMYALTCCSQCYKNKIYIIDDTQIKDDKCLLLGCCYLKTLKERKRVLNLSRKEYSLIVQKNKDKK